MAWTALHAALGELAGPMTFSMVERAIAEKIRERADLDWKRSLPLREEGNDEAEDELAKDVAAMSNSGGGVIVYGVAERDGRADALHPLDDLTEGRMRQIRQVASARIYPPLVDLDLIPLHSVDQPTKSVLLVVVPDSVDAPHLVHPAGKRELFRVPWRDGPETRFMVERQIESAYQARLQRRRAGGGPRRTD